MISCVTKLKIAEQDKIHRERLKAEYKEANPTNKLAQARRKRKWYEKHRERILEEKKQFYQENKQKFHDYYMSKKMITQSCDKQISHYANLTYHNRDFA